MHFWLGNVADRVPLRGELALREPANARGAAPSGRAGRLTVPFLLIGNADLVRADAESG